MFKILNGSYTLDYKTKNSIFYLYTVNNMTLSPSTTFRVHQGVVGYTSPNCLSAVSPI